MFDIEAKVEFDEDGCFDFTLTFKSKKGVKLEFFILEPYLITLKRWRKLIYAIENRSKWYYNFNQGAGDGVIECGAEYFECRVNSTNTCDFSIEVELPLNIWRYISRYVRTITLPSQSRDLLS